MRRGGWNGDTDDLVRAEVMGRGNASAGSADVKGLGQLNKLDAGSINTAEKDGHLQADTRRPTALNGLQPLAFVVYFDFQTPPGGTTALVRLCIFDARKYTPTSACK